MSVYSYVPTATMPTERGVGWRGIMSQRATSEDGCHPCRQLVGESILTGSSSDGSRKQKVATKPTAVRPPPRSVDCQRVSLADMVFRLRWILNDVIILQFDTFVFKLFALHIWLLLFSSIQSFQ
jgi:hypothetical protein